MKKIISLVMVLTLVLGSFSFGATKASTTFKSVSEVYGVYLDTYNYCYHVVDKKGGRSYTKIYGTDQYFKPEVSSEAQSKWMTKDKKTIEIYFGNRSSYDSSVLQFTKNSKGQILVVYGVIDGFSDKFKKFKSEADLKKFLKTSQDFKKKVKAEADEIKAEAGKKKLYEDRKAEAEKLLSDKNPLSGEYFTKDGSTITFDGVKSISVTIDGVTYKFDRQAYEGKEVPNYYGYDSYAAGESVIYLSYGRYVDQDLNDFNLQLIYDTKTNTFKVTDHYSVRNIENQLRDRVFEKVEK